MARVCFHVIAFNSDEFLEPALEAVAPFGPIVACEGPVRHWQERGYTRSTDRTIAILQRHCAAVSVGQWPEKDAMQAEVGKLTPPDTTHVWVVDADEVWPDRVLREVIAELDQWDSMEFRFNSFWCGFDNIIGGFEEQYPVTRVQRWHPGASWATHRPPTVLAPDGQPYRALRHAGIDHTGMRFWRCNHYSYCLPLQTSRKADYYWARCPSMNIGDWFERVYLRWATGDEATRQAIEADNYGVHNWLPCVRESHGCRDSYTRPWTGEHPAPIARRLPALRAQFAEELRLCQEAERV